MSGGDIIVKAQNFASICTTPQRKEISEQPPAARQKPGGIRNTSIT